MPGSPILHTTGYKIRIVGHGKVYSTFFSLDRVRSAEAVPFEAENVTDRKKTRLCNFVSQGMYLKIETKDKGAFIKVNDVTLFLTSIWSEFPNLD
jgi:hypothetical protein